VLADPNNESQPRRWGRVSHHTQVCHRRALATWWERVTGDKVKELSQCGEGTNR